MSSASSFTSYVRNIPLICGLLGFYVCQNTWCKWILQNLKIWCSTNKMNKSKYEQWVTDFIIRLISQWTLNINPIILTLIFEHDSPVWNKTRESRSTNLNLIFKLKFFLFHLRKNLFDTDVRLTFNSVFFIIGEDLVLSSWG